LIDEENETSPRVNFSAASTDSVRRWRFELFTLKRSSTTSIVCFS